VPYSSGTTGLQGVMLTHGNLVANLLQSARRLPNEGKTVDFSLAFLHIYACR